MNEDIFDKLVDQQGSGQITRKSKRDRVLGDQWVNWSGDLARYEWNIHEGRRLFLILSTVVLVVICSVIIGLWYLIYPRVVEFGSAVTLAVNLVAGGFVVLSFLWFGLMCLSAITERNFLKVLGNKVNLVMAFFPLTKKIAAKLGISMDRLGHSFIKVYNALTRIRATIVSRERLLILLPRCLTKPTFEAVKAIGEKYGCKILVAPGGDVAREMIRENQPVAVIGVACERDLVSGIQDVASRILLIGIPNIRSQGPCKNTTVDTHELEQLIKFLLGMN